MSAIAQGIKELVKKSIADNSVMVGYAIAMLAFRGQ